MKEFAKITLGSTGAIHRMRQQVIFSDGKLPAKFKALAATLWAISARCEPCIRFYVQQAVQLGTTMTKIMTMIGAVLSALAASACCWLPVILGAASAGIAGFGATLAPYRPYLIGFTFAFLAMAFYFTYRPAKAACPTCCTTSPQATQGKRLQKLVLWLVTLFNLGVIAYPYLVSHRVQAKVDSIPGVAVPASAKAVVLTIEKMSCPSCAEQIAGSLKRQPGVYEVTVEFDAQRTTVRYDPTRVNPAQLCATVERLGFSAREAN